MNLEWAIIATEHKKLNETLRGILETLQAMQKSFEPLAKMCVEEIENENKKREGNEKC